MALKRIVLWAGVALIAGAVVIVLWPLHANGVTGNAVWPRYGAFGFATYEPVPPNASLSFVRHLGVRVPQDVVAARRRAAFIVGAAGVLVVAAGLLLRRHRADSS